MNEVISHHRIIVNVYFIIEYHILSLLTTQLNCGYNKANQGLSSRQVPG